MSNNTVYVIGHKNPDTDSICSAIGYAAFKNTENTADVAYIPKRAGSMNPETEFVLSRFGIEAPELLENAAGETVILVDHNEIAQAADKMCIRDRLWPYRRAAPGRLLPSGLSFHRIH